MTAYDWAVVLVVVATPVLLIILIAVNIYEIRITRAAIEWDKKVNAAFEDYWRKKNADDK